MAFCPNPDCPHKKKTGHPAEFRKGFTHCSDCGSLLTEEVIEKEDAQKTPARIISADLYKRILYTIGFVVLWRVLLLIPVPGINFQALGSFFNDGTALVRLFGYAHVLERFSVCALGIMPYLSAYMFVEILSLFIQPLKSWRKEGYSGRTKLKKIALFATILLALLAGFGNVISFENTRGVAGETVALASGWFRIMTVITLTAGTFIMIWIADLITKKGIGHGISVLILAGFGQDIFLEFPRIISAYHQRGPLGYFLMTAAMVIALMALILLMEKGCRRISVKYDDGIEAYIPLKLTSAGITPVYWGSMLIGLPVTIFGFINNSAFHKLYVSLLPGHIWYYIVFAITIIFLYYLFTSFFYNPKKLATSLKNRQATIVSPPGKNEESYIDRSLEFMIPIAALYLCVVVLVPNAILGLFFFFHIDSIGLITAVVILLDLTEEVRLRSKGNHFVKVAELHDVPMVGLLKSLFEQKGLPCYLRGYYHRALLYFFGPYIEISVLVPEDRMIDAKEVIENYLDSNILTVQSGRVLGV